MMVRCELHGNAVALHVSPDLYGIEPRLEIREIVYEIGPGADIRVLCSQEFVQTHGVAEDGQLPLPEQFPEWFEELWSMCEKCADLRVSGVRRI